MTGIAFLDVQKAFDKVWHVALTCKLIKDGAKSLLFKIYADYLNFRYFIVRGGYSIFNPHPILSSTHQGALISPNLYNVFVKNISRNPGLKLANFDVDTATIFTYNNPQIVIETLQNY